MGGVFYILFYSDPLVHSLNRERLKAGFKGIFLPVFPGCRIQIGLSISTSFSEYWVLVVGVSLKWKPPSIVGRRPPYADDPSASGNSEADLHFLNYHLKNTTTITNFCDLLFVNHRTSTEKHTGDTYILMGHLVRLLSALRSMVR